LTIRFQADADLNHAIVAAVRWREPGIDFASAADANLEGVGDPELLDRAARENRILITHDRRTMPGHLRFRLATGSFSPGILVVSQFAPLGPVVEAIILVWSASEPGEWRNQIHHLPSLVRHVFTR
jgi:hypothetical protein